ncbi:hypothetical protein FE70_15020, partial [Staphylococcus aureus]|uniref:hypothetical protein n=1 Tax=Staphylococcus aureus TaxID=1280 RepID=UPI00065B6429
LVDPDSESLVDVESDLSCVIEALDELDSLIDVEVDTLVEPEPDELKDSDMPVEDEPLVEDVVLVDVESESDVLNGSESLIEVE